VAGDSQGFLWSDAALLVEPEAERLRTGHGICRSGVRTPDCRTQGERDYRWRHCTC